MVCVAGLHQRPSPLFNAKFQSRRIFSPAHSTNSSSEHTSSGHFGGTTQDQLIPPCPQLSQPPTRISLSIRRNSGGVGMLAHTQHFSPHTLCGSVLQALPLRTVVAV